MKRILYALAILLAVQTAFAQATSDITIIPSSAEPVGARHFFWRVRSATATVYLLGSIHMRPKVPLRLPEVVEQAFDASNYVGFEYDMGKDDEIKPQIEVYIHDHFMYPPGDDLKNHLTTAEWQSTQKLLQEEKIPEGFAIRYKPIFLSLLLAALDSKKHGEEGGSGIDEIFLRKAKAAGKPTFGMEFWKEPLEAFDTLNDHEQAHFLTGSAEDSANEWAHLEKIDEYWQTGDTAGVERLVNSDTDPEDKPLMDRLLKDRNGKWMRQMDRLLRTHATYFVVVGSAHLVGRDGLPNWLRYMGYTVEQL